MTGAGARSFPAIKNVSSHQSKRVLVRQTSLENCVARQRDPSVRFRSVNNGMRNMVRTFPFFVAQRLSLMNQCKQKVSRNEQRNPNSSLVCCLLKREKTSRSRLVSWLRRSDGHVAVPISCFPLTEICQCWLLSNISFPSDKHYL